MESPGSCEALGRKIALRIYQLQLVALGLHELALRADADPVEAGRRGHGAVGLDGDLEAGLAQRAHGGLVELEERLAARGHHEGAPAAGPFCAHGLGERTRVGEFAAAGPVGADEVGVAEVAEGAGAVGFAPRPQVAAGEAQKDGGAPALSALALQGVEDFFRRVHRRRV
jgi:hypothetical protein